MNRDRLDRAAIGLGSAAIISALLVFVRFRSDTAGASGPPRSSTPASLTTVPVIVLLVLGALAVAAGIAGGRLGRVLTMLAGAGLAAVAVVLLVQTAIGEKLIGGNTSSMALIGGLGLGLLAVGLTPRPPETRAPERQSS